MCVVGLTRPTDSDEPGSEWQRKLGKEVDRVRCSNFHFYKLVLAAVGRTDNRRVQQGSKELLEDDFNNPGGMDKEWQKQKLWKWARQR